MNRQLLPPLTIALVIVAILATSAFIYYRIVSDRPEVVEPPAQGNSGFESSEPAPPAPEPRLDIPDLEESDDFIRPLLSQLSTHPEFVAWLVPDRLVGRFVAVVDNAARGDSPRSQIRFLDPNSGFQTVERGDTVTIDPRSYGRYDVVAEVFTSLDTAGGVRLYRQLEPLFDQAYRSLGYPSQDFDETLAKAIDHILETPIPGRGVEIERHATSYHFKDPELEALSPSQKHFLRMGPSNMRQVQAKLRLMRMALGLPR